MRRSLIYELKLIILFHAALISFLANCYGFCYIVLLLAFITFRHLLLMNKIFSSDFNAYSFQIYSPRISRHDISPLFLTTLDIGWHVIFCALGIDSDTGALEILLAKLSNL